jgi:hypothetical protein
MGKLILISNKDDEDMYNELYSFKEFYSRTFNLITFKLEKGINLNTQKMLSYFDKSFCYDDINYEMRNTKIDIVSYLVRIKQNTYQIYIPNKYIFQDFCRDILLEEWYRLTIYENIPFRDGERRDETTNVSKLYEEISSYLYENSSYTDCVDSPYIHDLGARDTCQAKNVLRTLDGEFIKKIMNMYSTKVQEINQLAIDSETSWYRNMYPSDYIKLSFEKIEYKDEEE